MQDVGLHTVILRGGHAVGGAGDPAALWPWWSFGKTAIAATAFRLSAKGVLPLDLPLPGGGFTAMDLLRHQAGIPNYTCQDAYRAAVARRDAPWSRAELLDRVGADRLAFTPGMDWAYSNTGYLILRAWMEDRTGAALADLLRMEILAPLGLTRSFLAEKPRDFDQIVGGNPDGYDPAWVYHGCLVGPAADAATVLQALMEGRLLDAASIARMTDAIPLGGALAGRPWRSHGYGAGVMIGDMAGAGPVLGHTGGGPFASCAVYHGKGITAAAFHRSPDADVVEQTVAGMIAAQ
jgi:D-alanyl-D-alanine carboxypeptidase